MGNRALHRFQVLLAAVAVAATAASAQHDPLEIEVSISLPTGPTRTTTVTEAEVERLSGERPAYKLLPWVLAALEKLDLAHRSAKDEEGIRISSIAGFANGPRGEWVYAVNGLSSRYRLDTQTIEGVHRISFSFREREP